MCRATTKLKGKFDDEIKLAGLEPLLPEELEKYLMLTSSRMRTFEDARLEIVTYVEAKFGLRIRDSKPSDTGLRGHSSDPVKEKGHQFGDLITADHKVLNEEVESRNNRQYAVVVQDLATQLQPYPCKTQTSQETEKSLRLFLEPSQKPKVVYTETIH